MAEEELVAAAASPAPPDLKRKHEDLESEAPQPPAADSHENGNGSGSGSGNGNGNENENENENKNENEIEIEIESDSVKRDDGEEGEEVAEASAGGDADESEAKRPRLEEKPDALVTQNGFQEEKIDEPLEETAERPAAENNTESEDALQPAEEALETVKNELPSSDDHMTGDIQPPSVENPQLESAQKQLFGGELQEPSTEVPPQGDFSSAEEQFASETQTMSQKMEVPNNKVGVLIGKSGDTIRFLQLNSGAKIQITRDADADPYSATRLVELIGTMESVNKAERLIKDVIAEADAGGSPSLVARGFNTVQAAGAVEQILIQVPNEKVGLIIGKGGENIKNLQTRSGARIQLIPQHLPEGDQSKERTVRVSGEKKQIEMAREMIKEVMSQPVRPSSASGGYNKQQVSRSRGAEQQQQWGGPRGSNPAQPMGYDYHQRGPYPSQNSQYPPQAYGNYPQQQVAPRSSHGSGWEQRPPQSTMQQGLPPQSGGGYDYYGGQGGNMVDIPTPVPSSVPLPAHGHGHSHGHGPSPTPMGHPPKGNYNYNYGQPHGAEYGQPAPYSQTAPPPQNYGHGYNETKYEMQAPPSHYPYGGGHAGGSQPGGGYPQGITHPGYALQDQYGNKAPSYAGPPPSQHYGQPRAAANQQGGDMPYQGAISSIPQPYAQNAPPPQQTYPYVSSGPMQQQTSYPQYGSASATDGYNQPPPTTGSAPLYPQQVGGQPVVSGYGPPGGQQAPGYAQGGPTGGYGYGSYPSSQTGGYTEQPGQPNAAAYGYQGAPDPASYGTTAPGSAAYGAPTGQPGYAQPPATQPVQGYDQSVPHSGGYGSAPAGYGKSLSPQPGYPPQYDSTQMYGAHR